MASSTVSCFRIDFNHLLIWDATMRGRWPSLVSSSLLFCSVPISREHRDKHGWVVEEKGSSNVYISMHLPLLRVEGLESKSSSRHAYAGVIQHDSVAHLAAIIKDMPSSIASSLKVQRLARQGYYPLD